MVLLGYHEFMAVKMTNLSDILYITHIHAYILSNPVGIIYKDWLN